MNIWLFVSAIAAAVSFILMVWFYNRGKMVAGGISAIVLFWSLYLTMLSLDTEITTIAKMAALVCVLLLTAILGWLIIEEKRRAKLSHPSEKAHLN